MSLRAGPRVPQPGLRLLEVVNPHTRLAQVDWWAPEQAPPQPKTVGTTVYEDFPLEDVLEYIDWNPFFQACRCTAIAILQAMTRAWAEASTGNNASSSALLPRGPSSWPHCPSFRYCNCNSGAGPSRTEKDQGWTN